MEEIMNATKEKLDFLEKDLNKSSTESITNLFLDLFDSGLGEDGGHDWFARWKSFYYISKLNLFSFLRIV